MKTLPSLLVQHRETILSLWGSALTTHCLSLKCSSPAPVPSVRAVIDDAGRVLYDSLLADTPPVSAHAVCAFAAAFAVQDQSAVQAEIAPRSFHAASALYLFKPLLRQHVYPHCADPLAYLEIESRIDSLALLVFDEYAASRERFHALRLDTLTRSTAMLRRWADKHGFFAQKSDARFTAETER